MIAPIQSTKFDYIFYKISIYSLQIENRYSGLVNSDPIELT